MFEYVFNLKYNEHMELPGKRYDQQLDRSILVLMMVLRKKLNIKTRDLTSKSLVDNNSESVEAIRYIALCMDTAEQEYKHLSTQLLDDNI
jgi:hypothetical protein